MSFGWYEKEKLGNPNVPHEVDGILGSMEYMSGEIIYTYYKIGEKIYEVSDWSDQCPHEILQEDFDSILNKHDKFVEEKIND